MKKVAFLFLLLTSCVTPEEKKVNTILSMSTPKSQITLQGKTSEEIRAVMGDPTFVRKENPHESWVFKAPDCAVFIFFDQDGKAAFTESKGSCDKDVAKRLISKKNDGIL